MSSLPSRAHVIGSVISNHVEYALEWTPVDIMSHIEEMIPELRSVALYILFTNLAALLFVPLFPSTRRMALESKGKWRMDLIFGIITLAVLLWLFWWVIMTAAFKTYRSTSCLKMIGGRGCDQEKPDL